MINYIKNENSFNKLLKKGTKFSEDITFLFTSPYDKYSKMILTEVEKGNHQLKEEVHVVDSFETPHAFVAFATTQVPCLVSIKNRKKDIEYHVPLIYEKLGVSLP